MWEAITTEVLAAIAAAFAMVVGVVAKAVADRLGDAVRNKHGVDGLVDDAVAGPSMPDIKNSQAKVKKIVGKELKARGVPLVHRAVLWGFGRVGRSIKKAISHGDK